MIPLPSVSSSGDAADQLVLPSSVFVVSFGSFPYVTAPFVIVVAFPTEVTGPVRFASVVTVAAFPLVLFVIVPPFAVKAAMMSPPAADVFAIVGLG